MCCVSDRDLFYQDPVLFGSQDSLDSLIDDAALIIQVPRSQLHVVFMHFCWSPVTNKENLVLQLLLLCQSICCSLAMVIDLDFDLDLVWIQLNALGQMQKLSSDLFICSQSALKIIWQPTGNSKQSPTFPTCVWKVVGLRQEEDWIQDCRKEGKEG